MSLPDELTKTDRRELDDAVFELLGVQDAAERRSLVDRLYTEVATHFRAIRVTEIQKMEDRAKGGKQEFNTEDLAADIWDALDLKDAQPAADWLRQQTRGPQAELEIPRERPVEHAASSIFEAETVYFGRHRKRHVVCPNLDVARLVATLAEAGLSGPCVLPTDAQEARSVEDTFVLRQRQALSRISELVASRTSDEDTRAQVMGVLQRWFVLGRTQEA